jgi:hypothetical protein
MDLFPLHRSSGGNKAMGHFDGNTVTALWNYAQLERSLWQAAFGGNSFALCTRSVE